MTIEDARKSCGMSRKDVAEWLEIPYRTLTNWENGERQCPPYIEKLIVEKILTGKTEKQEDMEKGGTV
ncbi:MAG: helix-turn-helix domain-containing protein [Lachnospiraceae bacterium]